MLGNHKFTFFSGEFSIVQPAESRVSIMKREKGSLEIAIPPPIMKGATPLAVAKGSIQSRLPR